MPSGKITLIFGLSLISGKVVLLAESIVIFVVVAATTRPPLLAPARTGSLIAITLPGLTIAPESIEVVNEITSDSLCSAKRIVLPRRAA